MNPQAALDLEKLAGAGSVKTDMKQVTIRKIVFRNRGTIVKTGAGFRLEGLSGRVDLDLPEKIRSALKADRVKATVTGIPVQKSLPDPDNPEKIHRFLEVTVTEVTVDPSFDLPALLGSWSHHRERDGNGIQVWVRGGNLPPSRFRGKMVFAAEGKFKILIGHPADKHFFAHGTYQAEGNHLRVRYTTTHKGNFPIEMRLDVVRLEGDELRLKPVRRAK